MSNDLSNGGEWDGVSDSTEEATPVRKLSIAFYLDKNLNNMLPVSSLPGFTRKGISKALTGFSSNEPKTLQVYMTKSVTHIKESSAPYYVETINDEYSFTLTMDTDGHIKTERRYLGRTGLVGYRAQS